MAKSKKILPFRFTQLNSKVGKNAWALIEALKNGAKTNEL